MARFGGERGRDNGGVSSAFLRSAVAGLGEPRRGKVRDVYDLGDALLIVSSDRLSAFDVVLPTGIPDKGRILNQMSGFWFDRLGGIAPHHILSLDDAVIGERIGRMDPDLAGRSVLARKAQPLAIECVARGYLTGSLYREYVASGGTVHGFALPEGLLDGAALPEPIFTPATKAQEGHDENISEAQGRDLVGAEVYETVREWTLQLYRAAAAHAAQCGLILADTKFEFGLTDVGVIWIDEALTPDSSRYWEASEWRPGVALPGFDKQFVRDWLMASGWDKTPPGPELPEDVVTGTRERYLTAFRRLTGREPVLPSP